MTTSTRVAAAPVSPEIAEETIVDAARDAGPALAIAAAPPDDLAELCRKRLDSPLASEACSDGPELDLEAAGDPAVLRRAIEVCAGHGARDGLRVGHQLPDGIARVLQHE